MRAPLTAAHALIALAPLLAQENCNDVYPVSIGYDPFNSGRIAVLMGNDGPIGWSYPSLILYTENGDTLAWAQADYFALTDDQLHTLNIVENAQVPTGPFNAVLELWTGFNDSLRCTWDPIVTLCPPECTTVYPSVLAWSNDAGGTQFDWTVTDSLAQTVATGTIALPVGGIQAQDSVCLPPGAYELTVVNTSIPGDSVYFSMNGPHWNSSSSPQVELIAGAGSPFILMEACIDFQNAVPDVPANTFDVQVLGDAVRVTNSNGRPVGNVDITDAAGRLLLRGYGTNGTFTRSLAELPVGILLVRLVDEQGSVRARKIVWAR